MKSHHLFPFNSQSSRGSSQVRYHLPPRYQYRPSAMALLGISLLLASVVYVVIRPPDWLPRQLLPWTWFRSITNTPTHSNGGANTTTKPQNGVAKKQDDTKSTTKSISAQDAAKAAMPPPPPPPIIATSPPPPTIEEPESPTTPKAASIPTFSMPDEPASSSISPSQSSMMPPPPLPQPRARPPTLNQFPAANSAQRARGPAPNRGLAPPPTHSSAPTKPSRKVTLDPGHSPLDWARISGPNADLRGVEPSTPYLRVTPSMLKKQTGRKGKDAWMALNGKVYNVTPYAAFHPGGIPELMRGAARDGTKLFGEIHPWVNYETMLQACLVGLLVEEPEGQGESEMDQMD